MEAKVKAEKERKAREAEEKAFQAKVEAARREADESAVLKKSLEKKLEWWNKKLAEYKKAKDSNNEQKALRVIANLNKNKKSIEDKEKAAQNKYEDIQAKKMADEAAAAAKKFKEDEARKAAAEKVRLENEAKAKVKAAAAKAAKELAAKVAVEAKAKALKDLQEKQKYYQDQLDAATTEAEKEELAE
jgi:colicin import membrane protein